MSPAGEGGETEEDEDGASNPLDALRQQGQLQQLLQLVQQQPHLLEPILQQLGQTNPQLLQLINQNPEAFMQYLSGSAEGGEGGAPPGTQVIHLTEEEQQAVERLTNLGFDRNLALEAYLVCGKDETMAANYLFDNGNDLE